MELYQGGECGRGIGMMQDSFGRSSQQNTNNDVQTLDFLTKTVGILFLNGHTWKTKFIFVETS